ncbi:MAG: hypothetical protein H7256_14595 [Bdellovibrio sp.]|nr:hypothetical protein [Bdellovibrio sp.]
MGLIQLDMDLSSITLSSIMANIVFGVAGLWMFRQGKRNLNHSVLIIGILLMVYPYFTKGPLADWGVGIALCGLSYYLW